MNLLVLGATGRTGREIVDVALARGHSVTAFVRSPSKIPRTHPQLTVQQGDPLDVTSLSRALGGHDAVLSALGLPARQALRPSTFMTECAATTVAAMKTAGVDRLCILSAAVLFPGSGLPFAFFKWFLRHHARDLSAMETVVTASSCGWTIARPPRLVPANETRYVERTGELPTGSSTASFRAVATFMVDAVEQHTHVHAMVGLISPRAA